MTRKELIDYCLTYEAAYEDYPFDETWAVIRHRQNKKGFAFIYERNGKLCVNLKCEPMYSDFLRGIYQNVLPAYHMNKTHWNTVIVDSAIPEQELYDMIRRSYELILLRSKTVSK